jgi:4-carboxymuconolactone decarboxylase
MARVPYVNAGTSPAVDDLYTTIGQMGRPVLNLYRVLANQPPALAAFLETSRYVRSASSLDAGVRELAILATAHELGQPYEVTHHTAAAAQAGVTAEKVAAVARGGSLEALGPAELCAVEFARQVAHTRSCDDATFQRLEGRFSKEEIVDLVLTTAWYHLCAVILGSFKVELESDNSSQR